MSGVDLTSGWGLVASILAAFLLIAAALREGRAFVGWIRRRFFPEPPQPPFPPPVRISDQISAAISYAQNPGAPHRHLARISPRYEIHNGGGDYPIKDVTTGVRRRGYSTGGHRFDWRASDIEPLGSRIVEDVEIPPEMFRDVHESVNIEAFLVWARFTDVTGRVWEVTRDAHTKQATDQLNPPPLDAPPEYPAKRRFQRVARPLRVLRPVE